MSDRAALMARAAAARARFLSGLRQSTLRDWLSVDLTMPQCKVLMTLHAGEATTVGELAQALRVRLPTVSGILDRLEAQDLVLRASDARDRRIVRAQLTAAGAQLAGRLVRVGQQRFEEWLAPLDDAELEMVIRAFELLARSAERVSRAPVPPNGAVPSDGVLSRD